ncbi:MAG: pyrroline-5-carboxylate reductase [Candidatus Geothermarchaeales archaeon]
MRISVIGAGTIGRAVIECLLKARSGNEIMATRRNTERLVDLKDMGVEVTSNNRRAAAWGDVIILCVKPGDLREILEEIKGVAGDKLIISLAAAAPLKFFKRLMPEARFVRAMTNIAVLVQEAFTAYSTDGDVTEEDENNIVEIFGAMGEYDKVDEKYLDAVTGLSGSCPAYIVTFIEAFMYAGLKVGLAREFALYSAAQSVLGTAKLILESRKHPAELKDMVMTPGGVTIEGIYMLEDRRVRTAVMRAVEAATEKASLISKALVEGQ